MSKSKSFFKKTRGFTNSAFRKAHSLIEISQLNFKIAGLKARMERKFCIIGALVAAKKKGCLKKLSDSQCDEKIEKLCCDIEKLKKKTKKIKNEIDEIKQHMKSSCYCDFDCDDCEDCDFDFCDEEPANSTENDISTESVKNHSVVDGGNGSFSSNSYD